MTPERRKRGTKELTYTAAVERLMNLAADSDVELEREHDKVHARVVLKYRAKFAEVLMRVPEKVRASVAQEAGIKMPPDILDGFPDDAEPPLIPVDFVPEKGPVYRNEENPPPVPAPSPEPAYTADRMTPLDEKRIAVGRGR